MRIVIDSREKSPFTFGGYGCEVVLGALATGDYSLSCLEHQIAIGRKSLDDLLGCLISGRERFTRELEQARGMSCLCGSGGS